MISHLRTTAIYAAALSLFAFLLSLSAVEYVCKPYKPIQTCENSKYEITIYENNYSREPIGFLEADCVYDLGNRYKAVEVWFHTPPARTEFMEAAELPKKHIEICRVE